MYEGPLRDDGNGELDVSTLRRMDRRRMWTPDRWLVALAAFVIGIMVGLIPTTLAVYMEFCR